MITPRQIRDIARLAETAGVSDELIRRLRQIYPSMHFTRCLDDEINDCNPVQEGARCNLYLVDARRHCLCLTRELEAANGLVLAEVVD
jgi:hypothetical protein